MPKTAQVLKAWVLKHSQNLALGLRKNYFVRPQKRLGTIDKTKLTTTSNVTVVTNKAEKRSSRPFVTKVMGFLQITDVNLQTASHTEKIRVLCDSACSNSWISEKLSRKLNVQGTFLNRTVHGTSSHSPLTGKLSS